MRQAIDASEGRCPGADRGSADIDIGPLGREKATQRHSVTTVQGWHMNLFIPRGRWEKVSGLCGTYRL